MGKGTGYTGAQESKSGKTTAKGQICLHVYREQKTKNVQAFLEQDRQKI